jgi:hypothetical protein
LPVLVSCCYFLQGKHDGGALRFNNYKDYVRGVVPPPRTHDQMFAAATKAAAALGEDRTGSVNTEQTKGVTDKSPLFKLPYFDIVKHTLLDMMHITSGVVGRHLLGMLVKDRISHAAASQHKAKAGAAARVKKAEAADRQAEQKEHEARQTLETKIAQARNATQRDALRERLHKLNEKAERREEVSRITHTRSPCITNVDHCSH